MQLHTACKFAEPKEIDCCSGRKLNGPEFLKFVDAAIVDTVPGRPMYVERFSDYRLWGHLTLCDVRQLPGV